MAYKHRAINQKEADRPARKPRTGRNILLFLALLVSPLIYEWGLICYGNWQSMLGIHVSVRTPLLDALANSYSETRFRADRKMRPILNSGRWNPGTAIPIGLVVAGAGVLMLRKGH